MIQLFGTPEHWVIFAWVGTEGYLTMLSHSDHRYWAQRAETELTRARSASNEPARRAHHQLAAMYLNLVYGEPEGTRIAEVTQIQSARL